MMISRDRVVELVYVLVDGHPCEVAPEVQLAGKENSGRPGDDRDGMDRRF